MRLLLSCSIVAALLVGTAGPATAGGHRPGPVRLSAASVAEDAAPGTDVGTLSSRDRDSGYQHTFTLVPGAGDGSNDLFAISGDRLQVAGALDHETAPLLSVRVRVTDNKGLSRERSFRIAVTDVNEAPTAISLDPGTIVEGVWGGTVGDLSATDPEGDRSAFALVPGDGAADNGLFAIVGDRLQSRTIFDFESRSTYQVRVRATDAGGATFEQPLTVRITDAPESVNHAPTEVTIDDHVFHFPGTGVVGELSATDPDVGDTHTFTLVSAVDSRSSDVSEFVSVVGDELRVVADHCDGLDVGSYTVRVRAVDAGGLAVESDLVITVVGPARTVTARRC